MTQPKMASAICLVTDENGVALSRICLTAAIPYHQIEGQEGQAFVPDFTVFISSDGHLYSYILNNQTITSFYPRGKNAMLRPERSFRQQASVFRSET